MKNSGSFVARAALAVASFTVVLFPSTAQAASAEAAVMIDFTNARRDPDGTVFRPYEYAFQDWNKHIVDLPRRGTLIKAPSGKGGLGENRPAASFNKYAAVELQFVIGNANQAGTMNFSLEDNDGTEWSWSVPLAGKARGQVMRQRFDLTVAEKEGKPGKKPGLNLKKIAAWQVRGDWTEPSIEVLLVKLTEAK